VKNEEWREIEVEVKGPESVKVVEAETPAADKPDQVEAATQPDLKIKGDEDNTGDTEEASALDGIKTDGAQKRIRKLVRQKRELARRFQDDLSAETAKREALEARLKALEEGAQKSQEAQAVNYERQLSDREATANKAWQDAFDAGDKDGMLRAEDARLEAKLAKSKLEDWKRQKAAAPKTDTRATERQVEQVEDKPAGPDIHPKAKDWIAKQAWWDKDVALTATTVAIAGKLEAEGFEPGDDDYYEEVEKRLKAELPHKFREPVPSKPAQVVAGQSRSPAPNKVRLDGEDQRLARLMGLSLEEYARNKQQAEDAKGGYVAINVTRR
jgi:hypothetical protein